jgi:hypothetical protein
LSFIGYILEHLNTSGGFLLCPKHPGLISIFSVKFHS